jgi:hypothetical protein
MERLLQIIFNIYQIHASNIIGRRLRLTQTPVECPEKDFPALLQ